MDYYRSVIELNKMVKKSEVSNIFFWV